MYWITFYKYFIIYIIGQLYKYLDVLTCITLNNLCGLIVYILDCFVR